MLTVWLIDYDISLAGLNRGGFETMSALYMRTAQRMGGAECAPLSGTVLREAWATLALLKYYQGVGESSSCSYLQFGVNSRVYTFSNVGSFQQV